MMNFTGEIIEKAETAKSVEELMKIGTQEGLELTSEEAEKYFSFLSGTDELPDDALEAVAGGKGSKGSPGSPDAKFKAGQHVRFLLATEYLSGVIESCEFSGLQGAWYYVTKPDSGQMYRGESCDGMEWDLPLELSVYRTQVI